MKKIYCGILISIFFICCVVFWPKKEEDAFLEEMVEVKENTSSDKIQVDIKGAIVKPGVYELEPGTRIEDLILKSGGLLESADTRSINLSKKLEDEMVIVIYTKEEIDLFLKGEQEIVPLEPCMCPKIENNGCIKDAVTNEPEQEKTSKKVSINLGTVSDFQSLPGIGSSKAEAIVAYREEHGNFEAIEDIKNVSGIGNSTFEKIKDRLTL